MALANRPDIQVQLTPLPTQFSAATVSIPYYQTMSKVTLKFILKKVTNKNELARQLSNLNPLNHLIGDLCYSQIV